MVEQWSNEPRTAAEATAFVSTGLRNGDILYGLHIKWEKWRQGRGGKFSRRFLLRGDQFKDVQGQRLVEEVYDFLTKQKFDQRATDYIYRSMTQHRPMKKASFFAKARKEGFLQNTNNKEIAQALTAQLTKQRRVLFKRVDRLSKYSKRPATVENVASSLSDIKKIIGTKTTQAKDLAKQIATRERLLKRKNLSRDQAKWTRSEIRELNKELKLVQSGIKSLNKGFDSFVKNYQSMSPRKLSREYKKLLKGVSDDIIKKQQPALLNSVFRKTAGSPVNRVAQTEFLKGATKADRKANAERAKNSLKRGKVSLFNYALSASHNITDICDDHALADYGWGVAGVGTVDQLPIPGEDTHPYCECRIEFYKEVDRV